MLKNKLNDLEVGSFPLKNGPTPSLFENKSKCLVTENLNLIVAHLLKQLISRHEDSLGNFVLFRFLKQYTDPDTHQDYLILLD